MNDTELVKVFNTSYDLMEELASLCLFDSLVLHNEVEELTSTRILHDQVELLRSLNNLLKEILDEKDEHPTS
jgi:glutaredoxin-related protein